MSTVSLSDERVEERTTRVPGEGGAWIFILGEMGVFAFLFALYLFHRIVEPEVFLEAKQHLDLTLGTVNTLLLLLSSLFVVAGVRAVHLRASAQAPWLLAGAAVCGLAFTGVKYVEYSDHVRQGLTFSTNDFWSYYYILTGTHLLHLLIGVAVLVYMITRSRRPVLGKEQIAFIEGGACYWHMVDLVWIILFPLLYLMT